MRALDTAVASLAERVAPAVVDLVVAAEARGFILGGALARELGAGFVPAVGRVDSAIRIDGYGAHAGRPP